MNLTCITINQLSESRLLFASCYQDALIVTDHVEAIERFRRPCRINAITVLLCIDGEAECVINLHRYHVRKNMVVIGLPDDIIEIEASCHLDAYAVLMSPVLFNDLGLDSSSRSDSYLRIRNDATCCLQQRQMLSLKPYYALLCDNIQERNNVPDVIIKSLLRAFAYSVIGMMTSQQSENMVATMGEHGRDKQLFNDFMSLVKRYHSRFRGVKFYAGKLCLTPNYLSGVIKNYTGKTATEWVNDFVILEAKIMLKDTSLSIQEIAYRLHFTDQSTFGKYFKKLTGVSPKRYRDN